MNKKSLILNSIVAGLSVLFIAFMALPYAATAVASVSGYDILQFLKINSAETILLGLCVLLGLIAACLLVVSAGYAILRAANVVKTEKLDKVVKILNLVLTIILAALAIAVLVIVIVKMVVPSEGTIGVGVGMIINTIISIGALVLVCLNLKK